MGAAVILTSQHFWVIAGAQAVMCISGATIAPAIIGMTLGVVGQARFTRQNGRNQAFNHASAVPVATRGLRFVRTQNVWAKRHKI
nr:hypothetical protein [Mycobacterium sp. UM_CSW]